MTIYPIKTLTENDIPKNPLIDKKNYTTIIPSENIYQNGKELIDAYKANRSNSNYTIFLLPGVYDFSGKNLDLNGFPKIVGMGTERELVRIQSEFSGKGSGVVHEGNGVARLSNLSIQNTFSGVQDYWLQPIQNLENPYVGNVINNNCFLRSSFSSSAGVVLQTNYSDPNKSNFQQIYIYNQSLNKHKIAFKQILRENTNNCMYIIQDKPTQVEKNLLNLNDYETSTLTGSNINIFDIGIWKIVSGELSGSSLNITHTIAIEDPVPNQKYNSSSDRSLKYIVKSWPWLVDTWISAEITPKTNFPKYIELEPKLSQIKNVNFLRGHQSLSMSAPAYYGGTYIDCEAGEASFGGNGGFLEGNFINCKASFNSFAPQYHRSGSIAARDFLMENCRSPAYGLGAQGILKRGIIRNCEVGTKDFPISSTEIGDLGEEMVVTNLIQRGKKLN